METAMNLSQNPNSTPIPPSYQYCGPGLDSFHTFYLSLHGYFALSVCVFGCIANLLNIVILTRRELRSPTNALLTGLAVSDLLVMLDYVPFATHMYLWHATRSREQMYEYGLAHLVFFHAIFTQICHTISIWLTVTLAIWRYIAIAHPQKNARWCRMETTLVAIVIAYVSCPLICIPQYLAFSIKEKHEVLTLSGHPIKDDTPLEDRKNATIYLVDKSDLGRANGEMLLNVNFWIYSVVIKIIPCIALTVLSLRLIVALLETKKRRRKLMQASHPVSEAKQALNHKSSTKHSDTKERQTDRTTRMLLAVLLLFLITEFPQGILGLLSAVLGNTFFTECYLKLGEVMDIFALINSAINFILYCAMSRQFRLTFREAFCKMLSKAGIPDRRNVRGAVSGNGVPDQDKTTQRLVRHGTLKHETQVTQV